MGLVLVVLNAPAGDPGLDLLPDPVGWVLVLLGVSRLPERIAHRALMRAAAVVALVVSVLLWVPVTARPLLGLDDSLRWALDLPAPAFVLLLGLALGAAARDGADDQARGWWLLVVVGAGVTMLLPPVVYGAGVAALATVAVGVAVGTIVACLVLCFAQSDRPWVHDTSPG